jgi:glycosyltransferase involved in cell wall biosynthesis
VTLVTLPAENWRWRMRGGAVTLAGAVGELTGPGYRPDVVIASDMIDLALFRELTHRHWGRPRTILYMHENQLAYPSQKGTAVAFPWINWSSAMAADEIWFNSRHHLDTFFALLPGLFGRFPDGPHDGPVEEVRARSTVMPVGVAVTSLSPADRSGPARILWNHRWEHDKRPDRFMKAVAALEQLDFEVVLCGEERLGGDPARDAFVAGLGDRLVWDGHANRSTYVDLLNGSDIVVSTAEHEFFGISVVEAVAAGCCPVLPGRLSYPELIPAEFHAEVFYRGTSPAEALSARVSDVEATRALGRRLADEMAVHGWSNVAAAYDERLRLR